MGWTSYHATHYKPGGSIDRKAECDEYFMGRLNVGHYQILKSAMVGSVYYAAVKSLKRYVGKDANGKAIYENTECSPVWAAVFLTKTNTKDFFNFYYKDMSEDMFPGAYDCPLSILNLLSPTDNEHALSWRKACRLKAEQKKSPTALSNLPIGTRIQFRHGDDLVEYVKHALAYQFKRPFWYNPLKNSYIPAKRIPSDYKVVEA